MNNIMNEIDELKTALSNVDTEHSVEDIPCRVTYYAVLVNKLKLLQSLVKNLYIDIFTRTLTKIEDNSNSTTSDSDISSVHTNLSTDSIQNSKLVSDVQVSPSNNKDSTSTHISIINSFTGQEIELNSKLHELEYMPEFQTSIDTICQLQNQSDYIMDRRIAAHKLRDAVELSKDSSVSSTSKDIKTDLEEIKTDLEESKDNRSILQIIADNQSEANLRTAEAVKAWKEQDSTFEEEHSSVDKAKEEYHGPMLNSLHKYSETEQRKILRTIFDQAKFNVEKLMVISPDNESYGDILNVEANRLLDVWMSKSRK
jgi:hypothetical protein